jgi:hypothetical protein
MSSSNKRNNQLIRSIIGKKLMALIEAYPGKPWNWFEISCNPNITMDIIQANPDIPWDWHGISRNHNITMDIIQANPDKPWDWDGISRNPNLTMEFIQANIDKPWYWSVISGHNLNADYDKIEERINNRFLALKYRKQWWNNTS